jgi:hypothetical protein
MTAGMKFDDEPTFQKKKKKKEEREREREREREKDTRVIWVCA